MAPTSRIASYGASGALIVTGVLCAVLVGGRTGEILLLVLASLGLVGAVLLVFLEVGLSEDREREGAEASRPERSSRRLDSQRRRPRPPRR